MLGKTLLGSIARIVARGAGASPWVCLYIFDDFPDQVEVFLADLVSLEFAAIGPAIEEPAPLSCDGQPAACHACGPEGRAGARGEAWTHLRVVYEVGLARLVNDVVSFCCQRMREHGLPGGGALGPFVEPPALGLLLRRKRESGFVGRLEGSPTA